MAKRERTVAVAAPERKTMNKATSSTEAAMPAGAEDILENQAHQPGAANEAPEPTASAAAHAQADTEARERMQRAEVAVDHAGEVVGRAVSQAGHALLRMVSRAREEAEDIWVEAQHLSSRGHVGANGAAPHIPPSPNPAPTSTPPSDAPAPDEL